MNWFRRVPKWVLALILGGVSISFVFWGIGNVFSFSAATPLVKVGDTRIDVQAFQHEYNRYLKRKSDQENRQISTEEGRAKGLDFAARDALVVRLLLEQEAKDIGLAISRDQVIDSLKAVPGLTDANGNINPQALGEILQRNDVTEAGLIEQIQAQMIQRQLVGTMLANVALPPGLVSALQHFRLERRVAEYVVIDPTRVGEIKDPDDATLTKYYEANVATRFTAPEYRTVTVVSASGKEIAARLDVKEEEIKAAFEANKSRYQTPEKRKVQQVRFPSEEKARAARAQLDAGKSFEEVVKAAGYKIEDTDLGEVAAGDTTVSPEVFTIELMKPTQPWKGLFGWVIARPTSSTPGTIKTLDDVRQEIRDSIATEKAKDQLFKLSTDYDDARGGGATLEEAAKKLNLKVTKLAAIDRAGKNDAGQTVENLPVGGDFLARVFSTESGVETGLQETEDGVYYEFRVDSIKPAAKKPFAAVRADVLAMWRAEQTQDRLRVIAEGLVKRGNSGEAMSKIAGSLGIAALKSDPLPRYSGTAVFSPASLNALFNTKIGGFFSGPVADGKSIIVARVDSSVQQAEAAGSSEAGMYGQLLNQSFVEDVAEQFTTSLRHDICSRKGFFEWLLGSRIGNCVDDEQFKRVHAGE